MYQSMKQAAVDSAPLNNKTSIGPHLVGNRVAFDSQHFGTIRYVGPIASSQSNQPWIGVEWDNPDRGKHNGVYAGVQYFETQHPTSGSFVRPGKVSMGTTFLKAVNDRYSLDEEAIETADNLTTFVERSNGLGDVSCQFLGARKISQRRNDMTKLTAIDLFGQLVARCDDDDDQESLANLFPCAESLCLSRTLLPSWTEVAKICSQLPHLTDLNLSENRFPLPPDPASSSPAWQLLRTAFPNITHIVLTKIGYTWPQLASLLHCMPALYHLIAAYNSIADIPPLSKSLYSLKVLDLTGNQVSDIFSLGELPCLEHLQLKSNNLTEISFPGKVDSTTPLFPSLVFLGLADNKLEEWSSIDQLSRLTSLWDLGVMKNPLCEKEVDNADTAWQVVIAKMPRLKRLNLMFVDRENRRGAEIDYLKRFGGEWLAAGGNRDPEKSRPSEAFLTRHPRYQDLVEMYGAPEEFELKKITGALKQGLLRLLISCPTRPDKIEKSLPDRMTVQHVRSLIRRLFKLHRSQDMCICYTSEASGDIEFPIDSETRELGYYGLSDGDTLCVKLL